MNIQPISSVSTSQNVKFGQNVPDVFGPFLPKGGPDQYASQAEPPKVGFFRLAFNRLSKEQIAAVNESGRLPNNAKFYRGAMGNYSVGNKILGIRWGTAKLPKGYEARRSFLGFTRVVPKETQGLFLRKEGK